MRLKMAVRDTDCLQSSGYDLGRVLDQGPLGGAPTGP